MGLPVATVYGLISRMFADFSTNCKLLFERKTAFLKRLMLRGYMNRGTLSPFVEPLYQRCRKRAGIT